MPNWEWLLIVSECGACNRADKGASKSVIEDESGIKKTPAHVVGQDLSPLSLEEIARRIEELRGEIERLEAERARKEAVKGAADALFRKF